MLLSLHVPNGRFTHKKITRAPQNKNREARSQGADENYSSNPILFISIIIAVLVIAGGKGFFYQ